MMKIRTIEKEDLAFLLKLDRDVFAPHEYNFRTLRQMFDISQKHFLIAESGGKIVGYCLGAVSVDVGWMLTIAVHAAHRGHGIGKRLAEDSLKRFISDGVRTVKLTVHPDNISARTLYGSLGFEDFLHEKDYYGENEHRLVMKFQAV